MTTEDDRVVAERRHTELLTALDVIARELNRIGRALDAGAYQKADR